MNSFSPFFFIGNLKTVNVPIDSIILFVSLLLFALIIYLFNSYIEKENNELVYFEQETINNVIAPKDSSEIKISSLFFRNQVLKPENILSKVTFKAGYFLPCAIAFLVVGGTGFTFLGRYQKNPSRINTTKIMKTKHFNHFPPNNFEGNKLTNKVTTSINYFNYNLFSSYKYNAKLRSENKLTKIIFS
tara:strand:- start:236 stop:799 length:564 start_codon:yes stop_codon:yes gene_type:complete